MKTKTNHSKVINSRLSTDHQHRLKFLKDNLVNPLGKPNTNGNVIRMLIDSVSSNLYLQLKDELKATKDPKIKEYISSQLKDLDKQKIDPTHNSSFVSPDQFLSLKPKNTSQNINNKDLQKITSEIKKTINKASSKNKNQVIELQKQILELKNNNQTYTSKNKTQSRLISKLKSTVKDQTNSINNLKSTIEDQNDQIHKLDSIKNQLNQLTFLRDDYQIIEIGLKNQIEKIENDNGNKLDIQKKQTKNIDSLRPMITSLAKQINSLTSVLKASKNQGTQNTSEKTPKTPKLNFFNFLKTSPLENQTKIILQIFSKSSLSSSMNYSNPNQESLQHQYLSFTASEDKGFLIPFLTSPDALIDYYTKQPIKPKTKKSFLLNPKDPHALFENLKNFLAHHHSNSDYSNPKDDLSYLNSQTKNWNYYHRQISKLLNNKYNLWGFKNPDSQTRNNILVIAIND